MIVTMPRADHLLWIGSGVECFVWEWTVDEVLKTYRHKDEAERAMRLQQKAADVGLGPQTGGHVFEVDTPPPPHHSGYNWAERNTRWCFISERVDTDHGLDVKYDYDEEPAYMDETGELDELCEQLVAHGISTVDMHTDNIGRNAEGRLVRIDFGEAST